MWPRAFENILVLSNILILMKDLHEQVKEQVQEYIFLEDGACLVCTITVNPGLIFAFDFLKLNQRVIKSL